MPIPYLLIALLIFLPLAFTFWAIFDIPKRRFSEPKKQMTMFWVVASLPVIGALIYVIAVRPKTEPARDE